MNLYWCEYSFIAVKLNFISYNELKSDQPAVSTSDSMELLARAYQKKTLLKYKIYMLRI
jgi:hypothetical protein